MKILPRLIFYIQAKTNSKTQAAEKSRRMWDQFQFNNKATVVHVSLLYCSGFSIVNFEQLSASCVEILNKEISRCYEHYITWTVLSNCDSFC